MCRLQEKVFARVASQSLLVERVFTFSFKINGSIWAWINKHIRELRATHRRHNAEQHSEHQLKHAIERKHMCLLHQHIMNSIIVWSIRQRKSHDAIKHHTAIVVRLLGTFVCSWIVLWNACVSILSKNPWKTASPRSFSCYWQTLPDYFFYEFIDDKLGMVHVWAKKIMRIWNDTYLIARIDLRCIQIEMIRHFMEKKIC